MKHSLVCAGYHPVFYVFCRQDALYSCFRHAGTAREQEQQWAVACLGVRRSSIYPVGAGKDPCISFLDSSSNPFHLHVHVILPVPVTVVCSHSLGGLWVHIPSGNECLSLVNVVCFQLEVSVLSQSLVRRSRTECAVFECNSKTSTVRRSRPTRAM